MGIWIWLGYLEMVGFLVGGGGLDSGLGVVVLILTTLARRCAGVVGG